MAPAAFNLPTKYFLETSASYIEFQGDYQFLVKRGNHTGTIISASDNGTRRQAAQAERPENDLILLTRLSDYDNQRSIIVGCGTGTNGTKAAIDYLIHNWREIDKAYKQIDFAIILECPSRIKDPQGYQHYKKVRMFPNKG